MDIPSWDELCAEHQPDQSCAKPEGWNLENWAAQDPDTRWAQVCGLSQYSVMLSALGDAAESERTGLLVNVLSWLHEKLQGVR